MTVLGPLPVTHPRVQIVNEAQAALDAAYVIACLQFDLTTGERLRVLTNFIAEHMGQIAKYAIRHERHGRGDKPGDIES